MSFSSEIEKQIQEIIGDYPCKNNNSSLYFEVNSARKSGECIKVFVTVYIKECLDRMLQSICNLKYVDTWTIVKNPDSDDINSYIASLTFEICINCNSINDSTKKIDDFDTVVTIDCDDNT